MSSEHHAPPALSADNPLMPRLYQAAIGPLQTAYYQRQFERFDALGKPLPSWNWAAGCCTLGWMALRGLWVHAAVYAGVLLAVVALWWALGLNQLLPRPAALALALLLVLLAVLLPGLGGNALYHRAVRQRTMLALTRSRTLGEAMALLETQAPTPTRLQWATTGHALSALLVAGLVWGLGTLSTPAGPVHTGPTQQDTARALAALAPASTPDTITPPPAAAEAASAAPDSPGPAASNPAPLSPLEQPGQAGAATPDTPAAAATSALAASTVAAVTASAAPAPPAVPDSAKPAPVPEAAAPAKAAPTEKTDHGSPAAPNGRTKDKAGSKTDKAPSKVDKANKADLAEKPDSKHTAAGKTALQARKYYLNSGLYAQADNAQRVTQRLRDAGQPVFTQSLESRQGEVTRIRVGPFDSRAQAEAAASKIQGMKLEAQVFRHLPD